MLSARQMREAKDKRKAPPKKERREPANPRLWSMLVTQARARFHPYPSIPAQKWVHDEYEKRGGRFVSSKKDDDQHDPKTGKKKQARSSHERRAEKMEEKSKKSRGE